MAWEIQQGGRENGRIKGENPVRNNLYAISKELQEGPLKDTL